MIPCGPLSVTRKGALMGAITRVFKNPKNREQGAQEMGFTAGKRAASALLLSFLSACSASDSAPDAGDVRRISQSFNKQSFSWLYGVSCKEREVMRKRNIVQPQQRSTPVYFKKKSTDMVLSSPYLSWLEKRKARGIVDDLPGYVSDIAYKKGAVFVFTKRSLTEALPGYKDVRADNGNRPFYNTFIGYYEEDEKRLFVTFQTAIIAESSQDYQITGYQDVTDNRSHVTHHEIGHFLDDILTEVYGGENQIQYTDQNIYLKVLEEDFNELAASVSSYTEDELRHISYYLPRFHKGANLHGERSDFQATRKEVFAELWAELKGHGRFDLSDYFPRTYALVQQVDTELQQVYKQNRRECPAP